LTEGDFHRSATARRIDDLLDFVRDHALRCERILDIGCGYGGVTRVLGNLLNAKEIHGIDIDMEVANEARSKGLVFHNFNAETERFPFDDEYFDLVMSFGAFEHFVWLDNTLQESNRVLARDGHLLVSMPNLASWLNRLVLLFGYQPREVELSRKVSAGVHSSYDKTPLGHIHTTTTRALEELLQYYGFSKVEITGFTPDNYEAGIPFRIVDGLLARKSSLARRFYCLAKKKMR